MSRSILPKLQIASLLVVICAAMLPAQDALTVPKGALLRWHADSGVSTLAYNAGLSTLSLSQLTEQRSAKPYVLGGAVVGAVVTAGIVAVAVSRERESLTPAVAFIPAVAVGASLGALIGWMIHRLRE